MKQNKGITLIALVITIIVLLILAGVAISMLSGENGILNQAATAKTETEKKSTEEAVKLAAMSALTVGQGKIEGNTEALKVLNDELKEAGYSGTVSTFPAEVEIGEVTYTISANGVVEEKTEITWTKDGDLAIGNTVTANGEVFYIIGGDEVGTPIDSTTEKLILLAKYKLKKDGDTITLKQDTAVDVYDEATYTYSNACAFCTETAWSGASVADNDDLNTKATIKEDTTSAVYKAIKYGETLGATGRLMTYEEASNLDNKSDNIKNILYGQYESGQFINYWLGSACDTDYVWRMSGDSSGSGLDYGNFVFGGYYGVRPVVEISKTEIK